MVIAIRCSIVLDPNLHAESVYDAPLAIKASLEVSVGIIKAFCMGNASSNLSQPFLDQSIIINRFYV